MPSPQTRKMGFERVHPVPAKKKRLEGTRHLKKKKKDRCRALQMEGRKGGRSLPSLPSLERKGDVEIVLDMIETCRKERDSLIRGEGGKNATISPCEEKAERLSRSSKKTKGQRGSNRKVTSKKLTEGKKGTFPAALSSEEKKKWTGIPFALKRERRRKGLRG